MLISDLISLLRTDLSDERATRWSDARLVPQIGRAIRRIGHMLYKNDVELGRQILPIATVPGQEVYSLPFDYAVDSGLWRVSESRRMTKLTEHQWRTAPPSAPLTAYIIRGYDLWVAAPPQAAETLELVYWPLPQADQLGLADETPWDGKLDDMILEYTAYRLRNIDEMDQTPDSQIMAEMENLLIGTYASVSPVVASRHGWMR